MDSAARNLARSLHVRLAQDLGRELEEITTRGVQAVFVFSRGDPGIELLRIQTGSSMSRLAHRCRIHVIDGADHLFSQVGPRRQLEDILSKELFAHHLPATETSASYPQRSAGEGPAAAGWAAR